MQPAAWLMLGALALVACGDELELYGPRMDDDPVLLWVGRHAEAPSCPGDRLDYWEGWASEAASDECGPCTCGPAACSAPSSLTTYAAIRCDGEGEPLTIAAEEGWHGTCVAIDPAVSSERFASVLFEPPALAPQCAPSPPLDPPPISGSYARACPLESSYVSWADFAMCITPEADGLCRPGFKNRLEFTMRLSDNRACTPCACGAPTGGRCMADVMLYGDATCNTQIDLGAFIDQGDNPCHDVPAPLPLAAVRAVLTRQEPGSCTPTPVASKVVGTVERGERRVFCCET
jgi:hypothetical protein